MQVDVAKNECTYKVTREDDIVVEMFVVGLKEKGEELLSWGSVRWYRGLLGTVKEQVVCLPDAATCNQVVTRECN